MRLIINNASGLIIIVLLAISVLVNTALPAFAAPNNLTSINNRLENNANWIEDKTEVGYITLRCGILLRLIADAFLSDTRRIDAIVKQAEFMKKRSIDIMDVGITISKGVGLSSELIDIRATELSKVYLQQLVSNRALHNNIFADLIGQDFSFCRDLL
jgi:hypothetical protein